MPDHIVRLAHEFAIAHTREEEARRAFAFLNAERIFKSEGDWNPTRKHDEGISEAWRAIEKAEKATYMARCAVLRELNKGPDWSVNEWRDVLSDEAKMSGKYVIRRWRSRYWMVAYPDGKTVRGFGSGGHALVHIKVRLYREENSYTDTSRR
jgi:hypothetical protein